MCARLPVALTQRSLENPTPAAPAAARRKVWRTGVMPMATPAFRLAAASCARTISHLDLRCRLNRSWIPIPWCVAMTSARRCRRRGSRSRRRPRLRRRRCRRRMPPPSAWCRQTCCRQLRPALPPQGGQSHEHMKRTAGSSHSIGPWWTRCRPGWACLQKVQTASFDCMIGFSFIAVLRRRGSFDCIAVRSASAACLLTSVPAMPSISQGR